MKTSRFTRSALALALSFMASSTLAAPTAFQNPATASWGGWNRGDAGTLWAGWNVFTGGASLPLDSTPDLGSHNVSSALLFTNNPGAFVTGSGNLYSFSDVMDHDALFVPTSLGTGTFRVAVQISVLGADLAANSVLLNGLSWDSRTVLASGSSSAPPGVGAEPGAGTGVDNEYLFVWNEVTRQDIAEVFSLAFNAATSSMSLDALTIDVGPASIVPPTAEPTAEPTPEPTPVPIPGAVLLLSSALAVLGRGRLAR
jgi:hypothetical protein